MFSQQRFLPESIVAEVTLKRSIGRMSQQVGYQGSTLAELHVAMRARVGLFAGVDLLMNHHRCTLCEALAANCTLERFLTGVRAQMILEVVVASEGRLAIDALVRTFARVDASVGSEPLPFGETFVAVAALVGSLAGVASHVRSQVAGLFGCE